MAGMARPGVEHLQAAPVDAQGGEGDDDRREAQVSDEEAIQRSQGQPDAAGERRSPRPAARP